jgi:hypothetical protein
MIKFLFRTTLPAVLALAGGLVAAWPAAAQDGAGMRQIFGLIGILPQEKDAIEYRERPALVVPKDRAKLPAPEAAEAHARNGAWPVDPDAVAREKERQRRNAPVAFPTASSPSEGGRLTVRELAAGRSAKAKEPADYSVPRNDKDGVRLDIHQMEAVGKTAAAPSYPPGTEPPRQYLTDPPKGLRIPSANAPVGKKTSDGPIVDLFNDLGAWKRDD